MASLRKKTYTRALPEGAAIFERKGQRLARWRDVKGRKHEAPVKGESGAEVVVMEGETWVVRYRDHAGVIREVSTGCRDKGAAQARMSEIVRREEMIRS